MGGSIRGTTAPVRNSMRPPPRPTTSQQTSSIGRAPSPADSANSLTSSAAGTKRKERDEDEDIGEETNIHVVVRCRGRSEREVKENSGVVVSTSGVKGKSVELSMGPNSISNKTYHFDKVFSPAADQVILFEDVVAPILSEMLAGFNCTIFAYGQTGTGKTYTMSGDMTETFGLLSDAAGIIPRVLYSLFQKLELDETECSVKCSFIELYNEELRDLLSADDSVKLKIYDDNSKKGHSATIVQGMEESHIKNATDGIKLLREGSHRRQVAATKCNDLSSRSHTVFTITSYIKKPNGSGEDYICAGKLNLVDLAGSENIQRSGAENKRAAEAGLINKSLLTLGRVINALVDKSPHIPYRESKLTRLLQDSLGGRTKTCIIATVSPAKSNLEETISTLDYAFRAKNIRNKPQVNSMISKKTLLREFTTEIEKLKGELIATRQRNGVYLSNEQYEEMTVESESRRILSEEQKARIETLEISLRNKVQELYSLTNNFASLKKDNETTRISLETTHGILAKTEQVLKDTEQHLAEEAAVREAHQMTELKLLGVGNELISAVKSSTQDLDLVHAKVQRQAALHHSNRNLWENTTNQISDLSQSVDRKMAMLKEKHEDLLQTTSDRLQAMLESEKSKLESCQRQILHQTSQLEIQQSNMERQLVGGKESMNSVLGEIKVLREDVKEKVGQGLQGLTQAAAKISGEVIAELDEFHTQLHASYSGLGKDVKTLFEDLTKQLTAQKEESDRLRVALEAAHTRNSETTRSVSRQIATSVEEERELARRDRSRMLDQIKSLVEASANTQETRLETKLLSMQNQLIATTDVFEEADRVYRKGMDDWSVQDQNFMGRIVKTREEMKNRLKRDWTAINTRNSSIQESTKAVHEETVKIVDAQMGDMAAQMEALDEFVTRAQQQNEVHHTRNLQEVGDISTTIHDVCRTFKTNLEERKSGLDSVRSGIEQGTETLRDHLTVNEAQLSEDLRVLANHSSDIKMADYIITGETPQRKDWTYPTDLPRTQNQESLIARMRGLPDPALVTKTPSHTKTPGRSPKKQTSPRKFASPSKLPSPTKSKIYNDAQHEPTVALNSNSEAALQSRPQSTSSEGSKPGLKEIDVNVVPRPGSSSSDIVDDSFGLNFAKSLNGLAAAPPFKRHATTSFVQDSKIAVSATAKLRRGKSNVIVTAPGVENFSQSIGVGASTRRLRSSPPGQA